MIGKFSQSLKSTNKGDVESIPKSKVFDVIWLLNKSKNIKAGIDTKSNPELTLHEHMIYLFTMRQG